MVGGWQAAVDRGDAALAEVALAGDRDLVGGAAAGDSPNDVDRVSATGRSLADRRRLQGEPHATAGGAAGADIGSRRGWLAECGEEFVKQVADPLLVGRNSGIRIVGEDRHPTSACGAIEGARVLRPAPAIERD